MVDAAEVELVEQEPPCATRVRQQLPLIWPRTAPGGKFRARIQRHLRLQCRTGGGSGAWEEDLMRGVRGWRAEWLAKDGYQRRLDTKLHSEKRILSTSSASSAPTSPGAAGKILNLWLFKRDLAKSFYVQLSS